MQRLAQFDVSAQFLTRLGKLTAQIVFGVLCGVAMIGLRALVDLWAPGAGPFALIYPTVLLATLYGHWRAGLAAFVLTFLWAWLFVMPGMSFVTFLNPAEGPRVLLNAVCALVVIVFAEAFRRAARSTMEEIRRAADRRLMLLAELEHRTKNNFALVASLLEIQKRRVGNPVLEAPLEDAVNRVRTFADAYSNLALEQEEGVEVAMKPYLDQLLDRIERAALPENVELFREIDNILLPRQTGVAIGLYVNEAISNCAKYAFPEGAPGMIAVSFVAPGGREGWSVAIEDNGVGAATVGNTGGGLGSRLMDAFAVQASARHASGAIGRGFRAELRSDQGA